MFKNLAVIAVLIIISVPLFLHLDKLPFRLWDESRLAANAYEMNKDGNLIVTHYDGEPEMWSTKPPLMIWLQVACIKLLGFNELAVRLPSALAGFATCLLLLYFSRKLTASYILGAFAGIVLVTTNGYIDTHAIRTGDYDGLLALFTTLFLLSAFLFFETKDKRWIKWFFAGMVLAVLTKSIQPLVFLPGLLIYFFIKRKKILQANDGRVSRHFLIACFCSIVLICAYYITRELLNAGYLRAVWENELGGRYFEGLEENTGGPDYYAVRMPTYLFPYWIWFLPVSIVSGLLSKNERLKNLSLFLLITTCSYFLFITLSKTKLYWYTVPLFPLLALQIAILLTQLFSFFEQRISIPNFKTVLSLLLISLLFVYPYYTISKKVYRAKEYPWDNMYPISVKLQKIFHNKSSINNLVISYADFDQHLRIYAKALNDKGHHITFKTPDRLATGDTVIASEDRIFHQIEKNYKYKLLSEETGSKIYVLK
jgi:4-amino-4-deoxy-L-arabinose transferase-like glycosyltransferase